ncbi:MAG: hypothetical protein IJ496_06600 [Ruminococcus sp.]|nr:hypothetical protein [Ruminococcus sp.]
MTPEQWKELEQTLSSSYGFAKLKIDGYNITLVELYKGLRRCIAVYVDGKIKTENIIKDCDIRRRFYCKHTKQLVRIDKKMTAKMSEAEKKVVEEFEKENYYEHYEPCWTSFRSMKNHFIKNNSSIELVKD